MHGSPLPTRAPCYCVLSGAARLRDGNGEVTSQEASSMLTMCLTYTGGPPLAEASRRALRALARC